MRTRSIALLALISIPALAQAQYYRRPPPRYGSYDAYRGPGPQGPVFGLRLGVGFPSGNISDEGDPRLDDLIDNQVPIWVEMGYRFNPYLWGVVHGQFAPTTVADSFCALADCDAMDYRVGLELQLHLGPQQPFDPWFGIGFGYEWLKAEALVASDNTISDFTYSGWQLPILEGGIDFALSPNFALGPYVSWALGRYRNATVSQDGVELRSYRIGNQAYHSWFQLGVKGTFQL